VTIIMTRMFLLLIKHGFSCMNVNSQKKNWSVNTQINFGIDLLNQTVNVGTYKARI